MADEKRYQVFVSSTSEDLKGERQRVWETLVSLEYIVSGMEAFPATNDSQFQYIKQQIEQSDYYVLIIAGRYGTLTENGISFTEREFDFAQELKIPSLVFPIRNLASWPVGKTDNDQNKQEKLETFRTRASKNRLCYYWDSADELALGIVKALQTAIKSNPRPGWERGGAASAAELLSELRQLRNENDRLKTASQTNLPDEIPSGLQQEIRKAVSFSYFGKKVQNSIQLTLRATLVEISIFELPTFEVFEEALRGAIARRTGEEFDTIEVDRSETDRLILLLAKAGVIRLERAPGGLGISYGNLWIAAHSDVKLNR